MPKIIENLENRLLEEAKRQLEAGGYSAVTVRSVAAACGVGVGTVYNYFPSKEALVATYLLEDWKQCIARINGVSGAAEDPLPVLRCIYDELIAYAKKHRTVFQDEAASASFAGSFSRYHGMLREQLAASILKFCDESFAGEFVAEAMLTWTMAGKSFQEISGILGKLFE